MKSTGTVTLAPFIQVSMISLMGEGELGKSATDRERGGQRTCWDIQPHRAIRTNPVT